MNDLCYIWNIYKLTCVCVRGGDNLTNDWHQHIKFRSSAFNCHLSVPLHRSSHCISTGRTNSLLVVFVCFQWTFLACWNGAPTPACCSRTSVSWWRWKVARSSRSESHPCSWWLLTLDLHVSVLENHSFLATRFQMISLPVRANKFPFLDFFFWINVSDEYRTQGTGQEELTCCQTSWAEAL